MESCRVQEFAEELIEQVYSLNTAMIKKTLEKYYDVNCRLANPYMILANKAEIIKSFIQLANHNLSLKAKITNFEYNPTTQQATIQIDQTLNPKALGGILPIKMTQTILLQLEYSNPKYPTLLYVTYHDESHSAQEYISSVPILGSWYDTSIRETLGKLVLTTNGILDATGILDYVPGAFEGVLGVANSAKERVGDVYTAGKQLTDDATNSALTAGRHGVDTALNVGRQGVDTAFSVSRQAADATGVSTILSTATNTAQQAYSTTQSTVNSAYTTTSNTLSNKFEIGYNSSLAIVEAARQTALVARSRAAEWVEGGKGVGCYAPTCRPGVRCYSPSCIRNQPEGGFSAKSVVGMIYTSILDKKQADKQAE